MKLFILQMLILELWALPKFKVIFVSILQPISLLVVFLLPTSKDIYRLILNVYRIYLVV